MSGGDLRNACEEGLGSVVHSVVGQISVEASAVNFWGGRGQFQKGGDLR